MPELRNRHANSEFVERCRDAKRVVREGVWTVAETRDRIACCCPDGRAKSQRDDCATTSSHRLITTLDQRLARTLAISSHLIPLLSTALPYPSAPFVLLVSLHHHCDTSQRASPSFLQHPDPPHLARHRLCQSRHSDSAWPEPRSTHLLLQDDSSPASLPRSILPTTTMTNNSSPPSLFHDPHHHRRRLSLRHPPQVTPEPTHIDMDSHDHDHSRPRTRHGQTSPKADKHADAKDDSISISSTSKQAVETVQPFLAQHIPNQYNPLGNHPQPPSAVDRSSNTKYCYRHRPDIKCRRQANEPSMEQLQKVSAFLYFPREVANKL